MTTNVEITQEEINRLIDYYRYLETNPCFYCSGAGACCGCPKQNEWTDRMKEKKSHIDPECFNNSSIVSYTSDAVALENLEKKLHHLELEKEEIILRMNESLDKFTICSKNET